MKIRQAILDAAGQLTCRYPADARLEAELLLSNTLGINRALLYSRLEDDLDSKACDEFEKTVERGINFEPVAYILGQRQFYGIDFYVDRRVLVPRPETELLVENTLEFIKSYKHSREFVIADIGTGCGAVAIALALNLEGESLIATDISADVLEVARHNCRIYGLTERIKLLCGDTMEPVTGPVDVIVANLPYVKNSEYETLSPDIKLYEPSLSLKGGEDGLDIIRKLIAGVRGKIRQEGLLLIEADPRQMDSLESFTAGYYPAARISRLKDLAGKERVLRIAL